MMKIRLHATGVLRLPIISFAILLSTILCAACSGSDDYDIFSSIHGRVTDYDTGLPLENASVLITPTNMNRQTDADGLFAFDNLDAGQYTVIVQKAGYQTNRKTVTAISGESAEANITLTVIPQ